MLARRKILRFRSAVQYRRRTCERKRLALVRPNAKQLLRLFFGVFPPRIGNRTLNERNVSATLAFRGTVGRKYDICDHADDIKRDDTNDPRHLCFGQHVAVGDTQRSDNHNQPVEQCDPDHQIKLGFGVIENDDFMYNVDRAYKQCNRHEKDKNNRQRH